jgi:hypothetical protein
MECEKNILDLPLDASTPGFDDVVMWTKPDGTTVIRKWSSILSNMKPKPEVYDCNGSEGSSITIAALVGISKERIVDIVRSGSSCRSVVLTAPAGLDIQYDDGVAGVITVASDVPFGNGEYIKVIYI